MGRVRSLADRVRSLANRVRSLVERAKSLAGRVGSLADRVRSLADRVRSLADRVRSFSDVTISSQKSSSYQPSDEIASTLVGGDSTIKSRVTSTVASSELDYQYILTKLNFFFANNNCFFMQDKPFICQKRET